MSIFRNLLLWGSENQWLRSHVPKWGFVRKAVKRFMPGKSIEDAINAASAFKDKGTPIVFTHLGEKINDLSEDLIVRDHYLEIIDKIVVNGILTYDFTSINLFWIGSSDLSCLLALFVWNVKTNR